MIQVTPLASSSRGNAHHITDGHTPLLLDCGLSLKTLRRLLEFGVSDIAGCLVTHEHSDHSLAAKDLAKAGVDVYMSHGTAEALGLSGHRIQVVEPRKQFRVGTWTILPFDVEHDAKEPLGFLLANRAGDKALYATDTFYIRYKFEGLTHVLVECNYAEDILQANVEAGLVQEPVKNRLRESHFSLANVKEVLKANDLSKVEQIWLLHLSDINSDEARFKREIEDLTGRPTLVAPKFAACNSSLQLKESSA